MPSKPSAPKKPGSSLAAALSFLDSTKPVDLDPESATFRGSDDDDSDDERDRSHYAAVGKSALRAAVAAPIDEHGKYAGRSVSRKAVFSDASDDGEDDHDEDESDDEGDASDTEDLVFRAPSGKSTSGLDWGDAAGLDGDMSDYEPAEAFGRSDDDDDDNSEADAASGSDADEDDEESAPREENLTRKALDTADAAGTDAEKGAHIKAQMELWDALLDLRIRLQKVIAIANRFPDPDEFSDFATGSEDALEAAQVTLLDVAGSVTTAQQVLVDQNPLVQRAVGENVPKLGKRKTMDETWAAVAEFQDGFQAFRADALEKWHEKVSATAGVPLTKKFKAINTSLAHQLESVLSDRDRLVKRTQIKRAEYRILTRRSPTDSDSTRTTAVSTTGGKERDLESAAETAAASKTIRIDPVPSIFDDTDWYSVLLKEVIDRKLASNPSAAAAHVATMRAASRTKRAVDTRASKGRKLRFAPHEKLQHFMAPMPVAPYYKPAPGAGSAAVGGMGGSERSLVATGNLAPQIWHEEMIEELFSSLFGVKEERVRKEDVERKKREAERLAKQQAKVGKLRLFG
ncbi:hypothetical protein GGF32_003675 [Allomyces javanicus]|nr:hypothetical protein GGF32_003675 [Allomyces javanicus]